MKFAKPLAALAAAAFTTAVMAAVTFDPATGTGFVGKGDVQLAFGWNNNQLQTNASGVGFTYEAESRYAYTCTWITGDGKPGEKEHEVTLKKTSSVNSTVDYTARERNQINGFILNGYGSEVTTQPVPVVGGSCLGEGTNGTITAVQTLYSNGGLYVTYGGTSVLLN
jgi:hypothetical protein